MHMNRDTKGEFESDVETESGMLNGSWHAAEAYT
jgi:hypothetical protein